MIRCNYTISKEQDCICTILVLQLIHERTKETDDWRVVWGLQELVLRLLTKNINSRHLDVGAENISKFMDLENLFLNRTVPEILKTEHFTFIPSFFEDADIPENSIDLITSRSVLEHVMDYESCFDKFHTIMKPGGVMYHDIGLYAHSNLDLFTFYYNTNINSETKIVNGLNLLRLSDFLKHFEKRGFENTILRKTIETTYKLDRRRIAPRFDKYSDEDLLCSGAVIRSIKKY